MNPLTTPASPTETAGLPRAVDGPETTVLELAGASFDREAIDRNYFWMRERRATDTQKNMLDDVSKLVFGDPAAWRDFRNDEAEYDPRQPLSKIIDDPEGETKRSADREQKIAEMFDRLDILREFDPGTFANAPGSAAELKDLAVNKARTEIQEESDEVDRTIANRSDPSLAGGIASFVGASGAAISDVEGLATLPLGAAGRMTLARRMLIEGGIGAVSEAIALPAYQNQAEFLGRDAPDALKQILFGATFGAALPLAGRALKVGGNTLTPAGRVRNRELVRFGRRDGATPRERGAANAIAREVAAEDTAPAGITPDEHVARIDDAEAQIDAGKKVIVHPEDVIPKNTGAAVPGMTRQILSFITSAEAPHGYDTVYNGSRLAPPRPITSMTIREVLDWQRASVRAGSTSSAAGGYQIIRKTLQGLVKSQKLTGNELFDAAMQDRLAIALMREKGLDDFLAGKLSAETFGNRLASVWAGLPRVSGAAKGLSVYEGYAGNSATVGAARFMEILTTPGAYRPSGEAAKVAGVQRFPLADLRVDAESYQYKLDGDASGVNDRLRFEREWDPGAALGVIIHERLDGDRFVADGHQRFGLAQRLTADGVQGIELQGMLYREADGWSVSEVRAMAALRNIRQESGDAASAAKIIRDFPELTANISRNRNFMQQAEGLAQLHPGPFQAVINDVVPQHYGAIVGRVIPDDEALQATAVATLAKLKPQNQLQAEIMVADIRRLGLEAKANDAQDSLFGDGFDLGTTVISERARVIDGAMRELKKDKTVFARLSREDSRIEGAGNVLNKTENLTREETARKAIQRLVILADQEGPVRDALDAAARNLRAGQPINDAVKTVIDVITGADRPHRAGAAKDRPAGDGGAAKNGGLTFDAEPEEPVGSAMRDLDLFDDPIEGRGVIMQVESIERDLRNMISENPQADIEIPLEVADGGAKARVSEIINDIEDEQNFFDELELCMPKGAING